MDVEAEIRAEMARQGVSITDLARRIGVKRAYLGRHLKAGDLRTSHVTAIGEVLGVPASEFFRRAEPLAAPRRWPDGRAAPMPSQSVSRAVEAPRP